MPAVAAAVGGSLISGIIASDAAGDAADTSAAASNYSADLQKQMYDQTREDQTPWRETGANALSLLAYRMGLDPAFFPKGDYYTSQKELATLDNFDADAYLAANPDVARSTTGAKYAENPLAHFKKFGINENRQQSILDDDAYDKSLQQNGYGDLARSFTMDDFNADPGYQFRIDQGTNALQGSAAARGGLKSGNTLKALMEYGQNLGSQEYGNAYNRFNNDQNTQFNRLSGIAGTGQTANSALQSAGTNYANSVGNIMGTNAANQGNAMMAGANARASSFGTAANALGNYFGGKPSTAPQTYTSGGNSYSGDFVYDNGNLVPMGW